jgi:hypothetical protein
MMEPKKWTFPIDEEAKEWLRQRDEELPKMSLEEQDDWWMRYDAWVEASDG